MSRLAVPELHMYDYAVTRPIGLIKPAKSQRILCASAKTARLNSPHVLLFQNTSRAWLPKIGLRPRGGESAGRCQLRRGASGRISLAV